MRACLTVLALLVPMLGLAQPAPDEELYNRGVELAEDKSLGAAIVMFNELRRDYPHSKYGPRVLARLATIYRDTAMYDKAAELLEEYAQKYAGEKDAVDALSDAVHYRRAIGDDAKAIEDTKFFIKLFGAKRPEAAAAAHFALTAIYEKRRDADAVTKHLQEYVRTHGAKGGQDRLVIAHAKLGQLAWDASCPVKTVEGACVKLRRRAGVCSRSRTYEAVRRDDKHVKWAMASFAAAIKLFEKTTGLDAASRFYYARSLLVRIDAELEKLDPTDTKALDAIVRKYETVIAVKDTATTLHAAARIGRVYDTAATAVEQAATTKSACEKTSYAVTSLRGRAVSSYAVCLEVAQERSFFDDEGAGACARGMVRLDPESYPPMREAMNASYGAAPITATEMLSLP